MTEQENRKLVNDKHSEIQKISIWELPPARIIKDAMKCEICGNVGKPPYKQCVNGHMICGNHYEEEDPDVPDVLDVKNGKILVTTILKPLKRHVKSNELVELVHCPIKVEGFVCFGRVFEGNLPLYSTLYNNSIFNCANAKFGCEEKIPALKLPQHLLECPYKLTPCPNSYCTHPSIPHPQLLQHLQEHGLPFLYGSDNKIRVIHERLIHKVDLVNYQQKYFDWVGGGLHFEGSNFMLVVREEVSCFIFWMHSLTSFASTKKGSSRKYGCVLRLEHPKSKFNPVWCGDVASAETTVTSVINSGQFFKVLNFTYLLDNTTNESGHHHHQPGWDIHVRIFRRL